MLHDKLTADDPALRKAYFKMIVGQVALDNDQITIMESKAALEHALLQRDQAPLGLVSSLDWKNGAQERTRTSTPLRAPAPEAGASTNSATWARGRRRA